MVEGFFALLPLGEGLKVVVVAFATRAVAPFVGVGRVVVVAIGVGLEGRIVVQLGLNILLQFGQRHLEHPHQHHLLLCQLLLLRLPLLLFLYEFHSFPFSCSVC